MFLCDVVTVADCVISEPYWEFANWKILERSGATCGERVGLVGKGLVRQEVQQMFVSLGSAKRSV